MKRFLAWCLAAARRFRREALALAVVILLQHQGWLPALPADPFDPRTSSASAQALSPLWLTALTLAVALAGFFVPAPAKEAPPARLPRTEAAPPAEGGGFTPLPPSRPAR
ncbi:MAG: hypothetical protein QJR08_10285 [Bacillota bacterium]|nr:hypothetical protein [Bacillota bacterium]MDI3299538.1 hypothetical protein [Bacillota bacterium]